MSPPECCPRRDGSGFATYVHDLGERVHCRLVVYAKLRPDPVVCRLPEADDDLDVQS